MNIAPSKDNIHQLDEEQLQSLIKTLDRAEVALNDWVHSYAPEFSGAAAVKATTERLMEHGTLYYIATVLGEVRAARKFLSE